MEKNKNQIVKFMVSNIKSFIAISEKKQLGFSKEKMEELLTLGNSILENNASEENCNRFIEMYNSLDKTIFNIEPKEIIDAKEPGKELIDVLAKGQKQVTFKDLDQIGLQSILEGLQYEIDFLEENYDKNLWPNYINYYKYAYLYKKIKLTLYNLISFASETYSDKIESGEEDMLFKALSIAKECILELILIKEKRGSLDELDTSDCYRLHRELSDLVVKYMAMNFENADSKRI